MRQRAMIATALIASPSLVIADEPTTALDATVQAQIIDIWTRLNKEMGVALILVSHDLAVVNEVCDTLAVMYAGRIVEMGAAQSPDRTAQASVHAGAPGIDAVRLDAAAGPTEGHSRRAAVIRGDPGGLPLSSSLPLRAGCLPLGGAEARWRSRERRSRAGSRSKRRRTRWPIVARAPTGDAPAAAETRARSRGDPEPTAEEILALDRVTRHHLLPSLWPFMPPIEVHALDDVSLSLRRGETLGIAGEFGMRQVHLGQMRAPADRRRSRQHHLSRQGHHEDQGRGASAAAAVYPTGVSGSLWFPQSSGTGQRHRRGAAGRARRRRQPGRQARGRGARVRRARRLPRGLPAASAVRRAASARRHRAGDRRSIRS